MTPVKQTVILAAGRGTRLDGSGHGVPKPLVRVAGLPLVCHALAHAQDAGCHEAIIVIGHEGVQVRRAAEAIGGALTLHFVVNPDPSTPNGESLLLAEAHAAPRFFLQMVDHVFAEPVLVRLAARALGQVSCRVLVDRVPIHLDIADATKVRLSGRRVTAIGKDVDPWDAVDAGCFLLSHDVFAALRGVPSSEPRTVSSAMRRLAAHRALESIDLGGVGWADVDTPADRAAAERLLAASAAAGAVQR